MADPAFSVVVPAYNATRTIEATLRSILAQTEPSFELIVVDDESSDDTPAKVEAIASKDPRVTLHRQANKGVAGARNSGIAQSRAPLVAFLDNDDLWMPSYLENAGAALEAHPDAGFAYTDAYLLDDALARINQRTSFEFYDPVPEDITTEEFLLRLVQINFIMSSVTVRRKALEQSGGYSTAVNGVDDWDLWLRLLAKGWRATRIEAPLLVQRDRADSQSKDELMMLSRSKLVLGRLLDTGGYPASVETAARERLRDIERRTRREASHGPWMTAIRARRRLLAKRDQIRPDRNWRPEAPEDVARAFPAIAVDYGRATGGPS